MGNLCPEPVVSNHTEVSEENNEDDRPQEVDNLKFLLLGAGESGKSTLFKQMRINYVQDYSDEALSEEKPKIIRSIYHVFKDYLTVVRNTHGLEDIELVEIADELFPEKNVKFPEVLTDKAIKFMKDIWNSPSGQDIWENQAKYSFSDSIGYFMEDLDRFFDRGYEPTEVDYLKTRVKTTGIHEQTFLYKGVTMTVVDVGGQRNERHKWLRCLDGVTAIFFVAALSAFDQTLYEDNSTMRLPESLKVFKKVFNFLPFRTSETPFVLFLNKEDLLIEKLKKMENEGKNLDEFFPDLKLGTNYDNVVEKVKAHIRDKYLAEINEQQRDRVMPHYITATDKDIFLQIFQAATQIVLRKALENHFNK